MTVTRRLGTLWRRPGPGLACALLFGLGAAPLAAADALLTLGLGELEGPGWRASGIEFALHRDPAGRLAGRVRIASLELPPPLGPREGLEGTCRELHLGTRTVSCRDLALAVGFGMPQPLELRGGFDYQRDGGALAGWLEWPGAAPGRLRLAGSIAGDAWTLELEASELEPAVLTPFAALVALEWPEVTGRVSLSLVARGHAAELQGAVFALAMTGLGGSNDAGTVAADGIELALRGSAWPTAGGLALELRAAAGAGEVYFEPVYARLDEHPLRFTARGRLGEGQLELNRLIIEQQGTVHLDVAAALAQDPPGGWALQEARVRLVEAALPGAYEVLLQPFLAGTPLGDLQTAGRLQGEFMVNKGALESLTLRLDEVHLDDRAARLAAYGLSGELGWAALPEAAPGAPGRRAALRWSGGFLYGIPIGAAGLQLEAPGSRWMLAGPVSIPVLDGSLEIDALEFGDFGAGDDRVRFDARLSPLSMRALSRALDWPPLTGQLAGTLPALSYADGVLTVAGQLEAEVFDGRVTVDNLKVERLLGPLARLQADIEIRGIELAELTAALSFGLMTGRLDGRVRGLELIDWRPVAFDARLYTPPDDRARRRISQRAVDNIANLGGGGAGALSSGFLRFFEDFSYAEFALGCRLERDVCLMSGVEPREQGYVILRGRGLPRIDVMGFAQHVSWSALVAQLEGIMAGEGPEIR